MAAGGEKEGCRGETGGGESGERVEESSRLRFRSSPQKGRPI
jgi:hypothetical protein